MSYAPHPDIERAWIIRWRPNGRNGPRKQITVFDKSEAEAIAIEARMRQAPSGAPHNATNPLLINVIPLWLDWMRLHRSESTVKSIGWALRHLQPHFGHLTVGQIGEREILAYQHARQKTPRSCNLELDYLKSLIGWMVERHYCLPLPIKIKKLPYRRPLPRVPTPEDLDKWMAHLQHDGPWCPETKRNLPGPKTALVWIMLRCGLRFTEATHLQWRDIDFDAGVIYLSKTKGDRPRLAVLPDEARAILEPLRKGKTGLIAPNKKGQPYGHMKRLFETASQRSGIDIKGPHTLRHACGTYTLEATGDLRLVQETLGHTQIRTTELYTQVSLDRLRLAQAKTRDHKTRVHGGNPEKKKTTGE
jgi:integrase